MFSVTVRRGSTETGCFDLSKLVICGLFLRAHSGVTENSGHALYETSVRILSACTKHVKLTFVRVILSRT